MMRLRVMMPKVSVCLVTRYHSAWIHMRMCVYTEGVAQNRNIIMHLLSQVRIGMDLSRVC